MNKQKLELRRPIPFSIMRMLVETYYDFQHQRIMTGNRIRNNTERNQISDEDLKYYGVTEIESKAESFEKDIKKIFRTEMQNQKVYIEYLSKIYGIGEVITCGLLAYIDDIKRFDNISKLWQYAGFGMNTYCEKCEIPSYVEREFQKEGQKKKTKAKQLKPMKKCPKCGGETVPLIQKRMSGYMSNWNNKFKVLVWKVGMSFEKQGTKSGYYNLYKKIKAEERQKHPETIKIKTKTLYNDGHIRNMALRKVSKLFLAHLWLTWRELENLPVTEPYVGKHLGHDIIKPFTDK